MYVRGEFVVVAILSKWWSLPTTVGTSLIQYVYILDVDVCYTGSLCVLLFIPPNPLHTHTL